MQTQTQSQITPERVLQFAWGFAPTLIIEAAVRRRLFDVLEEGAKTVEQVAAATGAAPRALRAAMNVLAALNLLAKDRDGRYSLTPESAAFLVSVRPGFVGGLFRHVGSRLLPAWLQLDDVLRDGRPVVAVNQEPAGAQFFHEFVADLFPLVYPGARAFAKSLARLPVGKAPRVLDLGAGSGVWGVAMAQESPEIRVTAVDWVGVLPVARRMAERFQVLDQFQFVEGDLMKLDFDGGYTVVTLGHVLHCLGEESGRTLLKKSFDALAPGGVIAIAEHLVNEERTGPPQSLIFALNMMVHTDSGDVFSFGEIAGRLREAGFEGVRMMEIPGPSPLILATKPAPEEWLK
jgi:SAM-dependent methyltransferase